MTTYGAAWRNAACIVFGAGVLVALVGDDVVVELTVAGSVGFTAGVFAFLVQEARADPRHRLLALVVAAGATGASFGVIGLAALDGGLALVLVSLFTVVSPPALTGYRALLRGRRRATPCPTSGAVDQTLDDRAARDLTDAELSAAWSVSAAALDRARGRGETAQQARLVASRQGYLDELERRDPAGFHRWLTSRAGLVSDPGAFSTGAGDRDREHEDDPPRG